ncbi:RcnB family protein [Croceicoccus sp. BE223]|uniref:RcnB family protein n=1 Tax=Croceicoccus sp. BE223 TaxID=2817716 RepID=UPI0028553DB2|nr:RcnB family protein [Croceicoccus sp. BE223]MDR7103756.1 Ni/Co efflux regulator RcnB [Croceicoccus sp. BE223]
MKKLIAMAIAATMLTPAVMAEPAEARDRYERKHDRWHDKHDRHHGRYDRYSYRDRRDHYRADRRRLYARDWRRGERFDRRYVRYYRPVYYTDYRHSLYAPPRGYRWVRADDDALLIGITSGIVSAIVSNAFYR